MSLKTLYVCDGCGAEHRENVLALTVGVGRLRRVCEHQTPTLYQPFHEIEGSPGLASVLEVT